MNKISMDLLSLTSLATSTLRETLAQSQDEPDHSNNCQYIDFGQNDTLA